MNTLIAKNLNILIDFLAKRDLTALAPDELQAKYKINQADLLILFGGSIPEGADVFAKAHQQNIAKNYLLVGGAGHTTEALRQKMQSSLVDIDISTKSEAEIFALYLKNKYNITDCLLETKSTNCGNNITNTLELLKNLDLKPKSIIFMKDATKCLHSGYSPKNTEPRVMPIVQSTTYVYDSTDDVAAVFDEPTKSLIYSRFANPTVMAVENKIADLEGGVGAMCTTSGQAANLLAILNICNAGDSFISTTQIYGGTVNLFAFTLKKLGIECIFVGHDATDEEIHAAFKPNTKAVFGETLANPALTVFDIERYANIAHAHGVPLIVDNTFATPILCKPFEFGADIVTHSTSKYMDGHALQIGGVIVDSGNFNWDNGNFPELVEPDPSYHGLSYTKTYGKQAYILKARMQLMRDFGCYPAAHSAF